MEVEDVELDKEDYEGDAEILKVGMDQFTPENPEQQQQVYVPDEVYDYAE